MFVLVLVAGGSAAGCPGSLPLPSIALQTRSRMRNMSEPTSLQCDGGQRARPGAVGLHCACRGRAPYKITTLSTPPPHSCMLPLLLLPLSGQHNIYMYAYFYLCSSAGERKSVILRCFFTRCAHLHLSPEHLPLVHMRLRATSSSVPTPYCLSPH